MLSTESRQKARESLWLDEIREFLRVTCFTSIVAADKDECISTCFDEVSVLLMSNMIYSGYVDTERYYISTVYQYAISNIEVRVHQDYSLPSTSKNTGKRTGFNLVPSICFASRKYRQVRLEAGHL